MAFLRILRSIASRSPISKLIQPGTRKNLEDQVDQHYAWLQGGLVKRFEASALTSFEKFDVQVLSWTLDLTDEGDGLDQFLAAIPSLLNSSSVKNTQEALEAVSSERLSNSILQLIDHSFLSSTVSESARQQRSKTCMKILEVRRIPTQLIMEESLRFIGTGVFKWCDLGLLARLVNNVEAECVTALITAGARGSDMRWLQPMKNQLNVSSAKLGRYLKNGMSQTGAVSLLDADSQPGPSVPQDDGVYGWT